MSKEYVEYGVMVDWPHASSICGPVTTILEQAKLQRDTILARERSLANLAGVEPPPVRLVMHTVSPWREVPEPEEKENKQ